MKRSRTSRHARLTPRLEALIQLAEHYARSSCRPEDEWWETRLAEAIQDLLEEHNEEGLNAALDVLHGSSSGAYDALADQIEIQCETVIRDSWTVQLLAIPILAWSRFTIPATTIPAALLDTLGVQLAAHVLAANTRFAFANHLFSPDQLPQGFCLTAEMTRDLAEAALSGRHLKIDPATLPESMTFLADSRYVLAAVAAPVGSPLFRWQEKDGNLGSAERAWQSQGGPALGPLLTGCATQFQLPQAFFSACRDADRAARPFSLVACIEFLKTTLDLPAHSLSAVIAPFYEEELVEYRIGFTRAREKDVLYGLVWPLLDTEDERGDVPAQIEALLREHGVELLIRHEHRFPVEFCDDCGSPLYPNPDGEIVHAEMPEEETETAPRHLH